MASLADWYQFIGATAGIFALAIEGYKLTKEQKRNLQIKVDRDIDGIPIALHLENIGSGRIYIEKLYVFAALENESEMNPPGEAYFQKHLSIEPVALPLQIEPEAKLLFWDFISSSKFQIIGIRGAVWYQIRAIDSRGKVWNSVKYDAPTKYNSWPADYRRLIY